MERNAQRKRSPVFDSLSAFGVNAGIVEDIYERYEVDPDSVDSSWAKHFDESHEPIGERVADAPVAEGQAAGTLRSPLANQLADRHARVRSSKGALGPSKFARATTVARSSSLC